MRANHAKRWAGIFPIRALSLVVLLMLMTASHALLSPHHTTTIRRHTIVFKSNIPNSRIKEKESGIDESPWLLRGSGSEGVDVDDRLSSEESHHQQAHHSGLSRRLLLQTVAVTTASTAIPLSASAGKAELDQSGELFTPKSEMLRGGSVAARGVRLGQKRQSSVVVEPGKPVQTVYETRFLAYLTRFLLNFDPAAVAWWVKEGVSDSWERETASPEIRDSKFAEFAASVEMGLADYFVGPYGSYASIEAAKAGLSAAAPASSARESKRDLPLWERLFPQLPIKSKGDRKKNPIRPSSDATKQGVLNLYSLLKARYTSKTAKRQLAILFSLISDPYLQPVAEIRALLGEVDNCNVTKVDFQVMGDTEKNEMDNARTSVLRGGGYSLSSPPTITIDPPPALGDEYQCAKARAVMRPTSRVLRIKLLDGGEGYTSAPAVSLMSLGARRLCEACAILDREGHIDEILVLDPGYGYSSKTEILQVRIDEPKKSKSGAKQVRKAKAIAELEYEIEGIKLISGGNGYAASEPPKVSISPPDDVPDWFVPLEPIKVQQGAEEEQPSIVARISGMSFPDGNVVTSDFMASLPKLGSSTLDQLARYPLELIPSRIRPVLQEGVLYDIPRLPPTRFSGPVPSPQLRAYDPIFGGIGIVPVTKGAMQLSTSEYARLALSGAVCTVAVRTVLNPLELVKTKLQLENDNELNKFVLDRVRAKEKKATAEVKEPKNDQESEEKQESIGTVDMITGLVELRGFFALFQSADITFLASLVFGSFGFGATELFRRSFSSAFFSPEESELGSELILLAAAAVACVITSAAATPFEVLRVKSMGLLEPTEWKEVLRQFLVDKKAQDGGSAPNANDAESFKLTDLNPRDLLPLWSGFAPTVSRELPFAVTKFLAFDLIAKALLAVVNSQFLEEGALPAQVGVGTTGLAVSAAAGAFAGIAGAIVSHPADLILTLTSGASSSTSDIEDSGSTTIAAAPDWRDLITELLSRDGGIANLYIGLPARSVFFFLVIGLQFFLYDYVKGIFQVGSDDLSLVLDVFYAVRQGLLGMES